MPSSAPAPPAARLRPKNPPPACRPAPQPRVSPAPARAALSRGGAQARRRCCTRATSCELTSRSRPPSLPFPLPLALLYARCPPPPPPSPAPHPARPLPVPGAAARRDPRAPRAAAERAAGVRVALCAQPFHRTLVHQDYPYVQGTDRALTCWWTPPPPTVAPTHVPNVHSLPMPRPPPSPPPPPYCYPYPCPYCTLPGPSPHRTRPPPPPTRARPVAGAARHVDPHAPSGVVRKGLFGARWLRAGPLVSWGRGEGGGGRRASTDRVRQRAPADGAPPPPPPSVPCTNWTRLVPPPPPRTNRARLVPPQDAARGRASAPRPARCPRRIAPRRPAQGAPPPRAACARGFGCCGFGFLESKAKAGRRSCTRAAAACPHAPEPRSKHVQDL